MEILNGLTVESIESVIQGFKTTFTNGYQMIVLGGSSDGYGYANIHILDADGKLLYSEESF